MLFLVAITIFALIFSVPTHASDCRDIVDMKIHPIDCCIYPKLFGDPQIDQTCQQKCQTGGKEYCNRVCFLKETEVYADNKLLIENLKNLFTCSSTRGDISDAWKTIVDDSIKTCLKEHEVTETIEEDKISMVVFDLINCIRRHNFVACPDYKDSNECNDMKNAVKSCDKSTESMLFGVMHEQRKEDQKLGAHSDIKEFMTKKFEL